MGPRFLTVLPRGAVRPLGSTRSHLADGLVVSWTPPAHPDLRWAIDAELADQPVPPTLARRSASADPALFWSRWTRAEVSAKLLDIPILVWVSRHGLASDTEPGADLEQAGVAMLTIRADGLVLTYGARPA